jgi:hypothetical protein
MRTALLGSAWLATCLIAAISAQEKRAEFTLPVHWSAGDRWNLELTRERIQNGMSGGKSVTPVEMKVISKGENGYVILWTYGRTAVEASGAGKEVLERKANQELLERMAGLSDNLSLRIGTDAMGTPMRLLNKDEVAAVLEKAKVALLGWMNEQGLPQHTVEQVAKSIEAMSRSDLVENAILKDAGIFLLPSGGSFVVGEKKAYQDRIANPFGGEPFHTRAYFLLESIEPETGRATMTWSRALDREKSRDVLEKTVAELVRRAGPAHQADIDLSGLSLEESASYVYELTTGVPLTVEHRRAVTAGTRSRTDRLSFKRAAQSQ